MLVQPQRLVILAAVFGLTVQLPVPQDVSHELPLGTEIEPRNETTNTPNQDELTTCTPSQCTVQLIQRFRQRMNSTSCDENLRIFFTELNRKETELSSYLQIEDDGDSDEIDNASAASSSEEEYSSEEKYSSEEESSSEEEPTTVRVLQLDSIIQTLHESTTEESLNECEIQLEYYITLKHNGNKNYYKQIIRGNEKGVHAEDQEDNIHSFRQTNLKEGKHYYYIDTSNGQAVDRIAEDSQGGNIADGSGGHRYGASWTASGGGDEESVPSYKESWTEGKSGNRADDMHRYIVSWADDGSRNRLGGHSYKESWTEGGNGAPGDETVTRRYKVSWNKGGDGRSGQSYKERWTEGRSGHNALGDGTGGHRYKESWTKGGHGNRVLEEGTGKHNYKVNWIKGRSGDGEGGPSYKESWTEGESGHGAQGDGSGGYSYKESWTKEGNGNRGLGDGTRIHSYKVRLPEDGSGDKAGGHSYKESWTKDGNGNRELGEGTRIHKYKVSWPEGGSEDGAGGQSYKESWTEDGNGNRELGEGTRLHSYKVNWPEGGSENGAGGHSYKDSWTNDGSGIRELGDGTRKHSYKVSWSEDGSEDGAGVHSYKENRTEDGNGNSVIGDGTNKHSYKITSRDGENKSSVLGDRTGGNSYKVSLTKGGNGNRELGDETRIHSYKVSWPEVGSEDGAGGHSYKESRIEDGNVIRVTGDGTNIHSYKITSSEGENKNPILRDGTGGNRYKETWSKKGSGNRVLKVETGGHGDEESLVDGQISELHVNSGVKEIGKIEGSRGNKGISGKLTDDLNDEVVVLVDDHQKEAVDTNQRTVLVPGREESGRIGMNETPTLVKTAEEPKTIEMEKADQDDTQQEQVKGKGKTGASITEISGSKETLLEDTSSSFSDEVSGETKNINDIKINNSTINDKGKQQVKINGKSSVEETVINVREEGLDEDHQTGSVESSEETDVQGNKKPQATRLGTSDLDIPIENNDEAHSVESSEEIDILEKGNKQQATRFRTRDWDISIADSDEQDVTGNQTSGSNESVPGAVAVQQVKSIESSEEIDILEEGNKQQTTRFRTSYWDISTADSDDQDVTGDQTSGSDESVQGAMKVQQVNIVEPSEEIDKLEIQENNIQASGLKTTDLDIIAVDSGEQDETEDQKHESNGSVQGAEEMQQVYSVESSEETGVLQGGHIQATGLETSDSSTAVEDGDEQEVTEVRTSSANENAREVVEMQQDYSVKSNEETDILERGNKQQATRFRTSDWDISIADSDEQDVTGDQTSGSDESVPGAVKVQQVNSNESSEEIDILQEGNKQQATRFRTSDWDISTADSDDQDVTGDQTSGSDESVHGAMKVQQVNIVEPSEEIDKLEIQEDNIQASGLKTTDLDIIAVDSDEQDVTENQKQESNDSVQGAEEMQQVCSVESSEETDVLQGGHIQATDLETSDSSIAAEDGDEQEVTGDEDVTEDQTSGSYESVPGAVAVQQVKSIESSEEIDILEKGNKQQATRFRTSDWDISIADSAEQDVTGDQTSGSDESVQGAVKVQQVNSNEPSEEIDILEIQENNIQANGSKTTELDIIAVDSNEQDVNKDQKHQSNERIQGAEEMQQVYSVESSEETDVLQGGHIQATDLETSDSSIAVEDGDEQEVTGDEDVTGDQTSGSDESVPEAVKVQQVKSIESREEIDILEEGNQQQATRFRTSDWDISIADSAEQDVTGDQTSGSDESVPEAVKVQQVKSIESSEEIDILEEGNKQQATRFRTSDWDISIADSAEQDVTGDQTSGSDESVPEAVKVQQVKSIESSEEIDILEEGNQQQATRFRTSDWDISKAHSAEQDVTGVETSGSDERVQGAVKVQQVNSIEPSEKIDILEEGNKQQATRFRTRDWDISKANSNEQEETGIRTNGSNGNGEEEVNSVESSEEIVVLGDDKQQQATGLGTSTWDIVEVDNDEQEVTGVRTNEILKNGEEEEVSCIGMNEPQVNEEESTNLEVEEGEKQYNRSDLQSNEEFKILIMDDEPQHDGYGKNNTIQDEATPHQVGGSAASKSYVSMNEGDLEPSEDGSRERKDSFESSGEIVMLESSEQSEANGLKSNDENCVQGIGAGQQNTSGLHTGNLNIYIEESEEGQSSSLHSTEATDNLNGDEQRNGGIGESLTVEKDEDQEEASRPESGVTKLIQEDHSLEESGEQSSAGVMQNGKKIANLDESERNEDTDLKGAEVGQGTGVDRSQQLAVLEESDRQGDIKGNKTTEVDVILETDSEQDESKPSDNLDQAETNGGRMSGGCAEQRLSISEEKISTLHGVPDQGQDTKIKTSTNEEVAVPGGKSYIKTIKKIVIYHGVNGKGISTIIREEIDTPQSSEFGENSDTERAGEISNGEEAVEVKRNKGIKDGGTSTERGKAVNQKEETNNESGEIKIGQKVLVLEQGTDGKRTSIETFEGAEDFEVAQCVEANVEEALQDEKEVSDAYHLIAINSNERTEEECEDSSSSSMESLGRKNSIEFVEGMVDKSIGHRIKMFGSHTLNLDQLIEELVLLEMLEDKQVEDCCEDCADKVAEFFDVLRTHLERDSYQNEKELENLRQKQQNTGNSRAISSFWSSVGNKLKRMV